MLINGTTIEIKKVKGNIGLFNHAFTFVDSEKEIINEIIEWLSNNCNDNFIVTEHISRIVAGGCSDNKFAYKNGDFSLSKKNSAYDNLPTAYELRLSKDDIMHFRLRWIDESK